LNNDHEAFLERRIDSELKTLPNVKAPVELRLRVMTVIESKAAPGRSSWSTWPLAIRVVFAFVLVMGFAGLCFGGWHLQNSEILKSVYDFLAQSWSWLGTLAGVLETFATALLIVFKALNPSILTALVVSAAIVYFTWVALGTLWFRIAFARK
jgi:hypothetical protein